MSCATKIGHSITTGPPPRRLTARRVKQLIGRDPCQRVRNSRSTEYQDNIVRNGLADSEHADPGHVWGDEGPVNDE
jgi:hypothetical protein